MLKPFSTWKAWGNETSFEFKISPLYKIKCSRSVSNKIYSYIQHKFRHVPLFTILYQILKFVLKENCRKFILGVTKYLKKVSWRQVTWQQFFKKNCHTTKKLAVVLPTKRQTWWRCQLSPDFCFTGTTQQSALSTYLVYGVLSGGCWAVPVKKNWETTPLV